MNTTNAKTQRECAAEPFSLADYARLSASKELSTRTIYYAIVCNLLRTLHQLETEVQERILRKAPPLQGTPWDALLAATAEHFATRHGLAHHPWMNEPERFLDTPWMPLEQGHYARWETALYCAGAFARHGTPVHPSDLDSRGGDEPWKPDCCEATTFAEPSELLGP